MTFVDVVRQRTRTQRLTRSEFSKPEDVVRWLGAMQAQDFSGAKWAIGLRSPGLSESDVDRAFDTGAILRTHALRPTWHFLTPDDIRWVLTLTAPRVHRFNAFVCRKLELDSAVLTRCRRAFERALAGGTNLTRSELQAVLAKGGIRASGIRLAYAVMHAELEQVITSGPRRGKQFTYALLDARAPRARMLKPDEALAALTMRYFQSHGPATARDFSWWSGLTLADVRRGLDIAGSRLEQTSVGGLAYWFAPGSVTRRAVGASAFLLPNYDECLIAYKDRGSMGAKAGEPLRARDPFPHHLILDGRVIGSWSRTVTSTSAHVQVATRAPLSKPDTRALEAATERYGAFMSRPVVLSMKRG